MKRALRLIAASAFLVGLLLLAPAAQGVEAASLSLVVNFSDSGVVTVGLPNGTPVGSTSGTPTVIPAGFYTIVLNGPGECINLPLLELKGPGVNIQDDMLGGETDTHNLYATFLPNSTYTWHLDRSQSIVHTFKTSADVVGTAPANTTTPTTTGTKKKPTSEDLVGSAVLPFRGALTGAVSAAGRLTLAYKGKSVSSLKVGRYTLTVTDKSSTVGFMVQKNKRAAVSVTGMAYVGKRSIPVDLTTGKVTFMPRAGTLTYSISVR